MKMPEERTSIEINSTDKTLLAVALEERLKLWKRTLLYWEKLESITEQNVFVDGEIEECSSLCEAQDMVEVWEEFVNDVMEQLS